MSHVNLCVMICVVASLCFHYLAKCYVHDCNRLAELSASVVSVECVDCKKALC